MGMDIYLRTEQFNIKDADDESKKDPLFISLSRKFIGIHSGSKISTDITKIFNLDVSFLKIHNHVGIYTPEKDHINYVKSKLKEFCSTKEREEYIQKTQLELVKIREGEEYAKKNCWAKIEICEPIVEELILLIKEKPESIIKILHDKRYPNYFDPREENNNSENIITDLKTILAFFKEAKIRGAKKFAFVFL